LYQIEKIAQPIRVPNQLKRTQESKKIMPRKRMTINPLTHLTVSPTMGQKVSIAIVKTDGRVRPSALGSLPGGEAASNIAIGNSKGGDDDDSESEEDSEEEDEEENKCPCACCNTKCPCCVKLTFCCLAALAG
jgi:hypothetical protein